MERSFLTKWLVLFGILVVAFAGTVVTLNLTLYSASGFVGSYLQSLSRHDVDGALRMPGVTVTSAGSRELLTPSALGDLTDIALVSDSDDGDGQHTVTYRYSAGGEKGTTAFTVEYSGTRFGFFSEWSFVHSPISTLAVTPLHDPGFEANGEKLTSKAGANTPENYLVLTPGAFALSHHSTYLTAKQKTVVVDRVDSTVPTQVDVQASAAFVKEVQKELDAYLKKCVTQQVLLPTGCPMGKQITDRIQDAPVWSMTAFPAVTIAPGESGSWVMPSTEATAHLKVTVKSIFDGTVSVFDEDVPFSVRYVITFQPDGSPLITAQY